ncbi:MAG: prepilin-type N-terminal cleavage/methylation domain-containing protein [Elusimicrobia bacterium]|nr:prepilin-type N-terminal cleavage/methylation domain-containing protein [Elusimicrobiota bacterium]
MTKSRYIFKNSHKGVTLVELMMALAVLGIIIPAAVMLLSSVMKGFTGYEASINLKKNNQESVNRIYLRLGSSKRIFQRSNADYLGAINLTGCPAVLSGSQLPVIQSTGTLSFGTTNYASVDYGNSLYFATNEGTLSLIISTSVTKRMDFFQFNYYYLTTDNTNSIYETQSYRLVEWRSIKYADLGQITSISDTTLRGQIIDAVRANGINYAWDTSSVGLNNAFATLGTASYTLIASHSIPSSKVTVLTKILTNIMGGYRYGVSPNSAGWAHAPRTVPLYATANGSFPSGFEIGILGSTSGRKVLLRCVLVAQGAFPGIIGEEQQLVASARDLW